MTRRSDKEMLLKQVPSGKSIGNVTLRGQLGWASEKYWRVRDGLIDDGRLERGRGKGGSVRRPVTANGEPEPAKAQRRSPESQLYEPLLSVLRQEWIGEMRIDADQIHFEITANQGKKLTGGTWTRPDITAVSIRTFQYLPAKYLDVWTFEVKPLECLDVTAIFESASHASRATRSYALLEIPAEPEERVEEIVRRCEREAARLGVGLITFSDPEQFETWETRVEAPRLDTAPERLEEFIGHLSDAAKKRLAKWK